MELTARELTFGLLVLAFAKSSYGRNATLVPQNNYTVTSNDITCVVMTAGIQFTIPYMGQTKNFTSNISVPSTTVLSGQCEQQDGVDILNIDFNNDWQLSITFSNISKSAYQWQNVSLKYRTDPHCFPNISTSSENKLFTQNTHLPDGTMLTSIGGSYACAETVLQLSGGIAMNVSNLQYRALGADNSTWFLDTGIQHCSQTMIVPETDVALAVSVGIALGVFIVAVTLLYIVTSRIMGNKNGYEMG